jgi:hypothetical protein
VAGDPCGRRAVFGTHGVEIARIESGMVVIGIDYEPRAATPTTCRLTDS